MRALMAVRAAHAPHHRHHDSDEACGTTPQDMPGRTAQASILPPAMIATRWLPSATVEIGRGLPRRRTVAAPRASPSASARPFRMSVVLALGRLHVPVLRLARKLVLDPSPASCTVM